MSDYPVYIFEDTMLKYKYPLINNKPVWDLTLGVYTILERITSIYGEVTPIPARWYQKNIFPAPETKYSGWFISGSIYSPYKIEIEKNQMIVTAQGEILMFYAEDLSWEFFLRDRKTRYDLLSNREEIAPPGGLVYLEAASDFIKIATHVLSHDLVNLQKLPSEYYGVEELQEMNVQYQGDLSQLFISREATLEPFVMFDLREGPILIQRGTQVTSFSRLEGPLFIGQMCQVKNAHISASNISQGCRVSGEIVASTFLEYVNKQHESYVGHSYVGRFVNIGAGVVTSDLMNTYSYVVLEFRGDRYDTQMLKVGSFIGDFTRIGVQSLFPAGALVGTASNLFHQEGFHRKYTTSFYWGSGQEGEVYRCSKFLEHNQRALERRGKKLEPHEVAILELLYKSSF